MYRKAAYVKLFQISQGTLFQLMAALCLYGEALPFLHTQCSVIAHTLNASEDDLQGNTM